MLVAVCSPGMPARGTAGAAHALDCRGWLGTPVSGSPKWKEADLNNQQCAGEGLRILQESPAVAAAKAANAKAGDGDFVGDPFRAPHRWANKRGSYEKITWTDSEGNTWPAALFGPRDANGGPYPGVLLVCHACFPLPATTENIGLWYWAAETLAEAGYVVLYATVGGNSVPRTIDATDFFVSTPARRHRPGSSIPGTSGWIATVWGSSVTPGPRASRSTSGTPISATTRSWRGIRQARSPSRA